MLTAEHLTVKYAPSDARCALEDVSFTLGDHERTALLGPNGAGKSTLLLALVGILPALSGSVRADGVTLDKTTLAQLRQRLGLVFQNPDDQLFMPTVFQDVAFGPRNYGMGEAETAQAVDGALASLGISHLRDRMIHKLSGGEKRLTALAGVLAMHPSVLLLDEPTSFLDPAASRRLQTCLASLEQGMLITTHDLPFAMDLCERFLFLSRGRLVRDCTRRELGSEEDLRRELESL